MHNFDSREHDRLYKDNDLYRLGRETADMINAAREEGRKAGYEHGHWRGFITGITLACSLFTLMLMWGR